jgi:Stage II sporulation protein E (SpoIIE)
LRATDRAGSRPGATTRDSGNALEAIGRHIPLPLPVPDWSKPIILVLLLVAMALGLRARIAGVRARRLEGQRATLLRDVDAMQAALVPDVPARMGGLAVSVAYRPAEGPAAGGDFYDVFTTQPGKVAVILGDVAGHGHEALTQAALTRYTLRAYMQAGMEPRAALALAGTALADTTGERYATVIVGVYDSRDGTFSYACAGHPHPILHGLPRREPLAVYSCPPVGWGIPTGRRQTTLSLPAGAVVCLFSDGLVEARCEGELLGVDRLDQIVAGLGSQPDAGRLLERVRATATATPDDMAACVLVPDHASAGDHVHIEEVEADLQDLGATGLRCFLASCQVPASEITQSLARARAIADRFGTAVLRIALSPAGATASVSPPAKAAATTGPRKHARASDRAHLTLAGT